MYADELNAAQARASFLERRRYIPSQWAHKPEWLPIDVSGDRWMGMEAVRGRPGTDDDVLLVPLAGHTHGHCGIAVKGDQGWVLHCGDAYFHHGEMESPPHCPWGLSLFQTLLQMDGKLRHANQQRLRDLKRDHGHEVTLFCAHDPLELSQARQASARFS